ncbi:MAG: thioredoxin family protein [Burkholderiales bacterium]|nr:thioredoxin family protein [Burkholderiales bacterium]
MIRPRFGAPLAAAVLAFCTVAALAAPPQPFTAEAFNQLAHAGKPIVVDVAASWCTTCMAQKPIIDQLSRQPAYRDVAVLVVNFDDKDLLRQLKVSVQSTLIAFKGGREVARSIGDTSVSGINRIFEKAAQ